MVSNTRITYNQRQRKKAKAGKVRKKAVAKKGSTPKFPINPEKS